MASLNPPLRFRLGSSLGEVKRFQRGLERVRPKKVQRKLRLKLFHILLFFGLIVGFFLILMKTYLFLITWEELDVKKTEIACSRQSIIDDVSPRLDPARLGNLLVLDLARLRRNIEAHPWVREARLRKVFPSTLKVEIQERVPAAVLETDGAFLLIDREGEVLERFPVRPEIPLPLLRDTTHFQKHFQEKIGLAWACLDELPPEIRQSIDSLDLSSIDAIRLTFKDLPTQVLLGPDRFLEKIEFFRRALGRLENENGSLEYVDLRFDDRIYIRPLPVLGQAFRPGPGEEVN